MVKAFAVKNMKKRSASESEAVEKKVNVSGNLNKDAKKKKTENGAVQNNQANKQVKKDVPKKLKNESKKDKAVVQSPNKKPTNVGGAQKGKKKQLSPEQKLELLKKRQEFREKRKESRKYHGLAVDLTVDQLKKKIELIESRSNLTKSARRKLAALKKKLRVEEGTDKPKEVKKKQTDKAKNGKSVEVAKKNQVQSNEQNKKVAGKLETKSNKENKKKDAKQSNLLLLKQKIKKEEEEDDDDDEDDEDTEIDNESSEGEDDSDVEEEEEEEEEEDEEDDEDEEEEEEDEEDEENEQSEDSPVKKSNTQSPKEQASPKNEEDGKKKRYVLFVGNLPYNITNEELKKHFLTKVSQVVDIRIPKKDANTSRGFAYVELANNTEYEKALSLNHSFVNGRRINVQYSGNDRKTGVAKNFKLHALQKAGKFSPGNNRNNQRFGGYKGKQNMHATKT